jgi:hypothetical protein
MKLLGGQAPAPLVSISTYLVLITVLFATKTMFARVGCTRGGLGNALCFSIRSRRCFNDAPLRSIDGAFDTLC